MDLLAFRADELGAIAVQVTTQGQISNHIREYRRDKNKREAITQWLLASNRFVIHGWFRENIPTKSKTAKGSHIVRWRVVERSITLGDMELKPSDHKAVAEC